VGVTALVSQFALAGFHKKAAVARLEERVGTFQLRQMVGVIAIWAVAYAFLDDITAHGSFTQIGRVAQFRLIMRVGAVRATST
jgi:hypothetical protein